MFQSSFKEIYFITAKLADLHWVADVFPVDPIDKIRKDGKKLAHEARLTLQLRLYPGLDSTRQSCTYIRH